MYMVVVWLGLDHSHEERLQGVADRAPGDGDHQFGE
jgi:hypothetical protein